MELVERHIIKPNHRFYAEIDNLSFKAKNLYNSANYLYRQNFFVGRKTSAIDVYHQLKTTDAYLELPAKVAQEVLRYVLKAWNSYYQSIKAYKEDPSKFKATPRIPNYKGTVGDRSDGRYIVSYNNQAISKKWLKKGFAAPSKTQICIETKLTKIEQIRFVPRTGCYVV